MITADFLQQTRAVDCSQSLRFCLCQNVMSDFIAFTALLFIGDTFPCCCRLTYMILVTLLRGPGGIWCFYFDFNKAKYDERVKLKMKRTSKQQPQGNV